jgi:hypothetical protein
MTAIDKENGDMFSRLIAATERTEFDFLAGLCGGGRNNAYVLGFYERGIMPHILTFADTGGEKPETYRAVEALSHWCDDHLGQTILTVSKSSMYESLEDQTLRTKTLPSAAYGWRSCSDKWKIQPQDKLLNNFPPAKEIWSQGLKVTKALGYDAGERRRGENMTENAKYRFWFPLKDWNWYLQDCIDAFKRHGLQVPPKSACFYCPSSTKVEVRALAVEHPDLFARAVAMERNAENLQTVKGLGRHWKWEELVQISDQQMNLLPEAPQMTCTCLDGDED